MTEKITLTVQALCILQMVSAFGGICIGIVLLKTYVTARGYKTLAQKELRRLARHLELHHPETRYEEGLVVDKAIKLMR